MREQDERQTRRRAAWLRDKRHAENGIAIVLLGLWGMALVQLGRAWLWGVVWLPTRRGGDRLLSADPMDFWAAIGFWVVFGPGFMLGVGIFLWIGRNDPV